MAVQMYRKHKVVGSNPIIGLRESETDTQITLGSYPSNSGFDSRFRTLRIGRSYFVPLFLSSAGMSLRHIPKRFCFWGEIKRAALAYSKFAIVCYVCPHSATGRAIALQAVGWRFESFCGQQNFQYWEFLNCKLLTSFYLPVWRNWQRSRLVSERLWVRIPSSAFPKKY